MKLDGHNCEAYQSHGHAIDGSPMPLVHAAIDDGSGNTVCGSRIGGSSPDHDEVTCTPCRVTLGLEV